VTGKSISGDGAAAVVARAVTEKGGEQESRSVRKELQLL
jgi:hypothetical protein